MAPIERSIEKSARRYSDDNVEAAWELFEDKDYASALDRAMAAITSDEARESSLPDSAPYEIACMILRRQVRLAEEQDLLRRFFHRQLGSDVTREHIIALAVPPWENMATARVTLVDDDESTSHTPGQRPRPATWEMAARFARVTERLEKKPETNEERLARALTALPNEYAFMEAAVCIRKIISDAIKKRNDPREELFRLYRLAQQHAFLYGLYRLGWDHPENKIDSRAGLYPHVAAEMATEADMEAIIGPYQEVGYQYLPLLNKTDIKRLVTAFGDPSDHVMPRERNKKLWERYRKEARRMKREMFADTHVGNL